MAAPVQHLGQLQNVRTHYPFYIETTEQRYTANKIQHCTNPNLTMTHHVTPGRGDAQSKLNSNVTYGTWPQNPAQQQ